VGVIRVRRRSGKPATHALVIGVSRYPFVDGRRATTAGRESGLSDLTTAAFSASAVAAWLLTEHRNPDAPLADLHLFLSPTEGEAIHPEVAKHIPRGGWPADLASVRAGIKSFTKCCREDPDGSIFVYVAGHGVQLTSRDAIVLLEDFGADDQGAILERALDMAGEWAGFNGTDFPKRQVWFVDACRQDVANALNYDRVSPPWIPDSPLGDAESSPLILATGSRLAAFAEERGMTFFSQSLLAGLRGGGCGTRSDDTEEWTVTVGGLNRHLPKDVRERAAAYGEIQQVVPTGNCADAVIHRFAKPPDVEITVDIEPAAYAERAAGRLLDGNDRVIREPVTTWPHTQVVVAGDYRMQVEVTGRRRGNFARNFIASPLATRSSVKVTRR
jgi:hypothetical protein